MYDSIELRYMTLNYIRTIEDEILSDIAVYIVSKKDDKIQERNIIAIIYGNRDKIIPLDISARKSDKELPKIYDAKRLYVPNFVEDIKIYPAKENIIDFAFYEEMHFQHYLGLCCKKALFLVIKEGEKEIELADKKILSESNTDVPIISNFDTTLGLKLTGLSKSIAFDSGVVGIEYIDYTSTPAKKSNICIGENNNVSGKSAGRPVSDSNIKLRTDPHIKSLKYNMTGNGIQNMQIRLVPKDSSPTYTVALPKKVYSIGSTASSIVITSIGGENWKNRYTVDFTQASKIIENSVSISGEIENMYVSADAFLNSGIHIAFDKNAKINFYNIVFDDTSVFSKALEKLCMDIVIDGSTVSFIGAFKFLDQNLKPLVDANTAKSFEAVIDNIIRLQLSYYTIDYLKLKMMASFGTTSEIVTEKLRECQKIEIEIINNLKSFLQKVEVNAKLENSKALLLSREKSVKEAI